MAAISYDNVAVLKHFADRKGIGYPLLSDPESKIIREFGILNESTPKTSFAYGIPHPVVYVLDAAGVVQARYFEQDYRQRFTAADILVRRFDVAPKAAAGEAPAKHLTVRTSAGSAAVRGGHRIALMAELDIKSGFHAYAPGQQDYIAVDWKFEPSDGWMAHDVTYPPGKKVRLEGLNETALVYEGKVRLMRDLTIGAANKVKPLLKEGMLVVPATLRYQACDDRQCFPPETVALEWRLRFEDHDSQRAPAELRRPQ